MTEERMPTAERPGSPTLIRSIFVGAAALGLAAAGPVIYTRLGIIPLLIFALVYLAAGLAGLGQGSPEVELNAALVILFLIGVAILFGGAAGVAAVFFLACSLLAALLKSPRMGLYTAGVSVAVFLLAALILGPATEGFVGGVLSSGLLFLLVFAAPFVVIREHDVQRRLASDAAAATHAELDTLRGQLEAGVTARSEQLRTVIEVGRTAASIRDPDKLAEQVVQLISSRFGYYYAALFLLNERGDYAVLRSATGEPGRILLQNKHQLRVGGYSMVGSAIEDREPRITLEAAAEQVRFANPLLPYTRSEIALPLMVGDRVLGALDVQATETRAFGPNEIDTLQGMANMVAVAVENARLFEESRRSLEELHATQRQYVMSAWKPLAQEPLLDYQVGDEDLPSNTPAVQVPLALRDQIIGQISLAGEENLSPDERSLIEAVATQAALALENARLVEASQSAAQREHRVAEITSKVWATPTVEGILRTAVSELGRALSADQAAIEIRTEVRDGR